MQCPRCGNTKFETIKTRNHGEGKVRHRRCVSGDDSPGCGLQFRTFETIYAVEVFNHNTLKVEEVEIKEYTEKHLDKELQGISGFQRRMF